MYKKTIKNNFTKAGIKTLACLIFVFSIFTQTLFSQQEKTEGVKLSKVKAIFENENNVLPKGTFRHPNKAIWVSFNKNKAVYQCRIGSDGLVYKSQGTIGKSNQITWANFWTPSKIANKNDRLTLISEKEQIELIWVSRISNFDCSTPIPYKIKKKTNLDGMILETGKGTGSGSGFGGPVLPRPKSSITKASPPATGIKILSRPASGYTREARNNGVDGVVRLRVSFLANGKIGSVSVVKGLPHGLTEKAIAAAKKIRFKPATKNGVPISVFKVVSFTFTIL